MRRLTNLNLIRRILVLTLIACSCKSKEVPQNESPVTSDVVIENEELSKYNEVRDSIQSKLGELPTLQSIFEMAEKIIRFKDSLEMVNNSPGVLSKEDSILVEPLEKKGLENIMAYKRLLSLGFTAPAHPPVIIRNDPVSDPLSKKVLPAAGASSYFEGKNFYFLGGGPFLNKMENDQTNTIFKSPDGKPELRYSCSVNENALYLFDAIASTKSVKASVLFGPPLLSYEMGYQEVHGIGSLIHEFSPRIPVVFITEKGLVSGHLISVNHKLVPEGLGCVSDNPKAVFACQALPPSEILGIYIPMDDHVPASCTISRKRKIWTADFNGDNIPDLACVMDTFEGIASDNMSKMIWYVNINGTWKIVDMAEELDCT